MKRYLVAAAVIVALLIGVLIGGAMANNNDQSEGAKYTLSTYTGVGSGVFKHGTIVRVQDGQPVVVGHFDDDSGKDYPGTVEIKEQ